jgi:hypothetical protein
MNQRVYSNPRDMLNKVKMFYRKWRMLVLIWIIVELIRISISLLTMRS